nr:MAG TPA: hypothetical protein [Caudoviricetes sp.]
MQALALSPQADKTPRKHCVKLRCITRLIVTFARMTRRQND